MQNLNSFIPEKINENILNKGFYLYKWIKFTDLINVLKNKLIKIIAKFGKYIFIVLLVLSISIIPVLGNLSYLVYFLGFFILLGAISLIYLTIIGIQYSYYIVKNSFIVITNSALVINGKIINISDFNQIEKELFEVEELFQKKLFLDDENIFSYKNLIDEFKNGFNEIYKKKIGSIVFLLLAMYLVHIIIMSLIYFIGTILIVFISLFLGIINKFILIKFGHKVITINSLFGDIEKYSNKIENSKGVIKKILLKAQEEKYENGLINSINFEIIKFNNYVENSINLNSKLKNEIKTSLYNDIYDFNIYNNWIKNELYIPLNDLKTLLELSLDEIKKQIIEIENNIKSQKDDYKKVLELQKMSLDLFGKNIFDRIEKINYYLNLLKNL